MSDNSRDPGFDLDLLYRQIYQTVNDYATFTIDESGAITSWSAGAKFLFGYDDAEIIGQPSSTLFTPQDAENGEPERELTAVTEGRQTENERWLVRKDGSQFWACSKLARLDGPAGEKLGIVKVVRDGTERQQADRIDSHLAAIVESSDDAIISKSLEGIVLSWNKGAERIFGYSADEMIGKSIGILIPEDRRAEEPVILSNLREGKRIDHYETIRRTKNGDLINVSLTLSPIRDKTGKIIAVSKIARDITIKQQNEERFREQTEVLETIYHLGQVVLAELNTSKLVQAVTDAATELTGARFGSFFYNIIDDQGESYLLYTLSGVPREAFAHFPMPRNTDLFGPTFRGEGPIRIANVKEDPRYGKHSPYYGMPPGHLPVTSYLAVPVISRSGEVFGGLFFGHPDPGVFTERHEKVIAGLATQAAIAMDSARLYEAAQRDRSNAEEIARENERLYKSAQEANRMKDEFLATVSHELRTPLGAMLGWANLLRGGRLDPQTATQAAQIIERNARSQAQIIDDLLDVSRIITGKLRLNVRPVDPASFIDLAIDAVRPAAEAKGIRIQKIIDTSTRSLSGDQARLQQVIWNLLSNAIKFTPKQGRVQIRLEYINSHVEITISDTGSGIKPDFLPFVFDRFRQQDSSSTRRTGGLGLGLAIVRHVVELHGGSVSAASEGEGKGATFTVRLPVAIVHPVDAEEERVHSKAATQLPLESSHQLDGLKIVAVDDEADARYLFKTALSSLGAEVAVASSATEALDLIKEFKPDVIVSDVGMPGVDGYEFISRLRSLSPEEGSKIPAVALTAYARVEDRMRALAAGYQMHVPKPVETAELAAVIASLCAWDKR